MQYFQASEISRKLSSLRESFTNSRYLLWHCFAFAHTFVCIEMDLEMNAISWLCKTICTMFGSVFIEVSLANGWFPKVSAQNIVSFYFKQRQFAQCFLPRFVKFILHIYCLEGNIHFFRVLKSKIETNPLFGGNVFSPVMNLLHANPQTYFFLATLRFEKMLSFDFANCLPSVEMSWIRTVFEMMEEFFISFFKAKIEANRLFWGRNFAHVMKFSCCQEMTSQKMAIKSCNLKKECISVHVVQISIHSN